MRTLRSRSLGSGPRITTSIGPRKVWLQLNREGIPVARSPSKRLMKDCSWLVFAEGGA
jgi:hypothetical protein